MIVSGAVEDYLRSTRAQLDPVLFEMEAHGERDRIPIVPPETRQLLHVLALACELLATIMPVGDGLLLAVKR